MRQFGKKVLGAQYIERKAVYGIVQQKTGDKIGVIRLKTNGLLVLPGGGMEKGEDKLSCLEREVMEETGYSISQPVYVCKGAQYFQSRGRSAYIQNVADFYSSFVGARICDPIEADHELLWMSPEEAAANLFHEHQTWAIRCYFGLSARVR
ncbi:NUDIX domain-containing protein [Terribacillus sp. DMT04]|uniref:NUDIX domain-containing protein n=1 Tax=Terribacillus sp. DMT04 TaxID=2850441 RepID=UPI001C2C421C|nr:NUDIX domain-containing protein [Terribacillus sp. DMT04]QXE02438.1 NUDIX domain-containing protein [Terribacillus sp. DMT04]